MVDVQLHGEQLVGDGQWHLDLGRRLPLRVRGLNEQKLSHGKPTMVDVQLHGLAVASAVCSNQQCCLSTSWQSQPTPTYICLSVQLMNPTICTWRGMQVLQVRIVFAVW